MGEKNNVMCEYLSKPEVFADFVNVGYFHGKKEILPQQLSGSRQVSYARTEHGARSVRKSCKGERSHDVVKIDHRGRKYVIIGIENQQMVHYAMPLRCMEYDVREYRNQLGLLKEKNLREDKEARKNTEKGKKTKQRLKPQEFLSGMRKEDKLNPVVTIVFYHGKNEYDGCTRLHDMLDLEGKNSIFRPYTADYKMNLITLDDFEEEKCVSGLRELIGFLKCRQSKEKMQEYCLKNKERIQNMDEDTFDTISVMLDKRDFLEVKEWYRNAEGGAINMCKAMEDWGKELLDEGTARGISQGIEAFIAEFREEGRSDKQIVAKLIKRFSLSEAEAEGYLKKE